MAGAATFVSSRQKCRAVLSRRPRRRVTLESAWSTPRAPTLHSPGLGRALPATRSPCANCPRAFEPGHRVDQPSGAKADDARAARTRVRAMRRWNGWGEETIEARLPDAGRDFLRERIGETAAPNDAALADVLTGVRPSRLPEHRLVSQDAEARLRASLGQSLEDWLRLRFGRLGPRRRRRRLSRDRGRGQVRYSNGPAPDRRARQSPSAARRASSGT